MERATGSRAGTVMREKIGYCRQKAAECAARAQEAADKDTRELFIRFGPALLDPDVNLEQQAQGLCKADHDKAASYRSNRDPVITQSNLIHLFVGQDVN